VALVSIARAGRKVTTYNVTVVREDADELWLELPVGETEFGRGRRPVSDRPRVDVNDPGLSRHHFTISCSATGDLVLRSGDSTGGTFINDRDRVTDRPHALKPGDVVHLGLPPLVGRPQGARLVIHRGE
jgi:hypothetical protein